MTGGSDTGGVARRSMGYEPSLDGLRALSVIGVLFYHGGFSWMRGGFLGVEVFFVVSGFLITSLLIGEQEKTGRIDFKNFWIRRGRRLLPAFFAMLFAVLIWAAFFGSERQLSELRRDVPWSVFYLGNWGQILGDVPYFGSDPLLKHVWSLAVEEQWYLLWPLAFVGLMKLQGRFARTRAVPTRGITPAGGTARTGGAAVTGALLVVLAVGVMGFTFWLESGSPALLGGPIGLFEGLDRTNFMYLSTITRSSGLLLGAGMAFVWRPWRSSHAAEAPVGALLDPIGAAAVAGLGCAFTAATLTDGYVYQWLLPLTSVMSVIAVMVGVHPAAVGFRAALSWQPLVEVGKRSYGLYLWSWPIFVIAGAIDGSVVPFIGAMALSVIVSEISYQFVETPIRQGLLGRLWVDQRELVLRPMALGLVAVVGLGAFYVNVDQFNPFVGGEEAVFDAGSLAVGSAETESEVAVGRSTVVSPGASVAAPTIATTIPPEPDRELTIVGDSQAVALANNVPTGFDEVFPQINGGGLDGCSVWDSGKIVTARNFTNNFAFCEGWQEKWREASEGADVALVVIGAWDVFDIDDGANYYTFETTEADVEFAINLRSGIDAVLTTGADVAVLEVPCMRPVSAEGAGAPPLPERGMDDRVAHINVVIRQVSSEYGPEVRVVDGPDEWCNDEAIATDIGYRWDGVHVYEPGARLIFEEIGAELLELVERET